MIRYCYASISENGTVDGKAGDQTGREVRISKEYAFGQNWVIRCKSKTKRLRIASAARRIVNNDNVGYSQLSRSSLKNYLKDLGWKISKIKKVGKCNCDCSSMACCAVNAAYNKEYAPMLTTSNMPGWFMHSPDFEVYLKKTLKGFKLKKGDLVGKTGHVVVVYEGGKSSY